MGEGGCVLTSNLQLARIVESMRDWGRDCWCEPGEDDACHKRFKYQLGDLPARYDHKYTFSHVGYNLKATDLQAALGLSQLTRLDEFKSARQRNWQHLHAALEGTRGLILPRATEGSDPSWFGFAVTLTDDAPFDRYSLLQHLASKQIGTRLFFAGNITRHPGYLDQDYRIVGDLTNSDIITERTFWLGVYPGLTVEMVEYVAATIREFVSSHR
jgi:CDP-6-deoxy-D-xylo-4-hexulose-3-dehydrase